jgi:CheY-like chemotaxis protein
MLRFEVEDTGPGMSEEELAVLFEAFVQTKAGLQAQEGTGLGLAISQKFAQMMGGSLGVHSMPGQGSVFTCDIPCLVVNEEVCGMQQNAPRVVGLKPGQPTYRLLVVDDQSDNRQLLVSLLSSLGFDLREACNGQEALEIWQEWQPDLIWMDMRMPVMDGYEAARRIKSSVGREVTKVIALTASAFEDERSTVLMAGCDDFVRKPFHEEEILAILQKYIHVEYVYDEEPSAGRRDGSGLDFAEGNEQSFMQEWTVQNLQLLPVSWISEVHHAATLGEIHILLRLVDQVKERAPRVAAALKYLANNFRFDYITEACLPLVEGDKEGW